MSLYARLYEKEGPGVDRNAPRPKGLRAFFGMLAREWKGLVCLNLLFVLCCLPVFTLGAACGAMTSVTMRMARDQPCSPAADFCDVFRREFRRYSLAGWLGAGLLLLLAAALAGYLRFSLNSPLFLPLFMLAAAAALVFGLCWRFVLPLCAVTALPLRAVLRNALCLGAACVRYALPALACELALAFACVLFFPVAWPLLLACGFSLLSSIGSFSAWAGIRRYVVRENGA